MVAERRKIQMELAFDVGSRGEAPSTGDKGTEATMAKSRTESSASDTLACPNRRVRDPYARWCGRRGVARRPPIPIVLWRESHVSPRNFCRRSAAFSLFARRHPGAHAPG